MKKVFIRCLTTTQHSDFNHQHTRFIKISEKQTIVLILQWNQSKPNLIGTNFRVRNRQMFGLYKLN